MCSSSVKSNPLNLEEFGNDIFLNINKGKNKKNVNMNSNKT